MQTAKEAPKTRLVAVQREQTPQALARLAVIGLFIGLWFVLWIARLPMPVPFLIVLVIESVFFLGYLRTVSLLPTVRAVSIARYVMLASEIGFHTAIVYFLGSVSWLGAFAYVFGLIFTNAFLDLKRGLMYAAGASAAFASLILLEATGTIPHYSYLDQGPVRYTDPKLVATTIIGGFGVFVSISLWVNWVGRQLRIERDTAVHAQEDLIEARSQLQQANEALEMRVRARTADLESTNAALRASEERLRTVISNAPIALLALDREGVFTFLEGKGLEGLGVEQENVLGRSALEMFREAPDVVASVRQALAGEAATVVVHAAGQQFETQLAPVRDFGGRISGVIGVATNVTERLETEMALRQSEHKFRAMAETLKAAAFIAQGSKIVYVNPAAQTMTGYTDDELLGMDFWQIIHPDFQEMAQRRGMARQRGEDVPSNYELAIVTKSGETRWVDLNAGVLELGGAPAVIATALDVTDHKLAEEALREAANCDPLTGLLNRRAGLALLQERHQAAQADGSDFVMLALDLDRFKVLNDTYGHEIGDAALLTFAGVLLEQIGDKGIVCRIGGDEFEIGVAGVDSEEAMAVASGLLARLRQVLASGDLPPFTVSIGFAASPQDGNSLIELSRLADHAMYAAKAAGGDRSRAWHEIESDRAA